MSESTARSDEKVTPKHVAQFVKYTKKKMFWGCFSYFGKLVPVNEMMNGDWCLVFRGHFITSENCFQMGQELFNKI